MITIELRGMRGCSGGNGLPWQRRRMRCRGRWRFWIRSAGLAVKLLTNVSCASVQEAGGIAEWTVRGPVEDPGAEGDNQGTDAGSGEDLARQRAHELEHA